MLNGFALIGESDLLGAFLDVFERTQRSHGHGFDDRPWEAEARVAGHRLDHWAVGISDGGTVIRADDGRGRATVAATGDQAVVSGGNIFHLTDCDLVGIALLGPSDRVTLPVFIVGPTWHGRAHIYSDFHDCASSDGLFMLFIKQFYGFHN